VPIATVSRTIAPGAVDRGAGTLHASLDGHPDRPAKLPGGARLGGVKAKIHFHDRIAGVVTRARHSLIVLLAVASTAVLDVPVGTATEAAYRIGPEDLLVIYVLPRDDLQQMVEVRSDGRISLSIVGVVEAGGLTVGELSSRLTTEYGRTLLGVQVIVGLYELRGRCRGNAP
jgi:protein involved in polysaccharide export with SLBB domain